MCPPTLATPGSVRSSSAAASVIRLISWSEVPAIALQCTTRVLSARTGTTGWVPASCGASASPASATTAAAANTHRVFPGPPLGVSMIRLRTLSRLLRVAAAPLTMTEKTFCSSYRLPTSMPCRRAAAARRTSPGTTPAFWAAARFTLTSAMGCSAGRSTWGLATPAVCSRIVLTSAAFCRRIAGSSPKTRTAKPLSASSRIWSMRSCG